MIHKFQLEIVSPEALVLSKEVVMVVCPGEEGDFGVLAGHAPLIAMLRPGVLNIYENDDKTYETYFITGGFAEVTNTRCTVLADMVKDMSSISQSSARDALDSAQRALADADGELARKLAEQQIAVASAMLTATGA